MERVRFTPTPGETYLSPGGTPYRCIRAVQEERHRAILQCVTSRWTFLAVGIGRYADGTIDWDYSICGRFITEERKET